MADQSRSGSGMSSASADAKSTAGEVHCDGPAAIETEAPTANGDASFMDDLVAESTAARSAPAFMNAAIALGPAAGVQYAAPVRQENNGASGKLFSGGGGASAFAADELALEATRPADVKRVVVVSTSDFRAPSAPRVRGAPASPAAAIAADWGGFENEVRRALRTLQQTLSTSLALEEDNAGGAFSMRVDLLHEMQVVTFRINLASPGAQEETGGRGRGNGEGGNKVGMVEQATGKGAVGGSGQGGNPLLCPVQTHDFGPCAVQSTRVFGCIRGFNRFQRELEAQLQVRILRTRYRYTLACLLVGRAPGRETREVGRGKKRFVVWCCSYW